MLLISARGPDLTFPCAIRLGALGASKPTRYFRYGAPCKPVGTSASPLALSHALLEVGTRDRIMRRGRGRADKLTGMRTPLGSHWISPMAISNGFVVALVP